MKLLAGSPAYNLILCRICGMYLVNRIVLLNQVILLWLKFVTRLDIVIIIIICKLIFLVVLSV